MIKFEIARGLLFVPVIVQQGKHTASVKFIIDTGAAGSAIDISCLRPDFSRPSRFAEISGVGGSDSVLIQDVDVIQFGAIRLEGIALQFSDLENSFGVQGIIGNNILNTFKADINYESCIMSLKL
jgi:hypothetical protein